MEDRNRSPCCLLDAAPASRPAVRDAVVSFELEPITDAAGPRRIKGVAKEADKINMNRYYFSLDVLTDMVAAAQADLAAGRLFGLVQHPEFWADGSRGRIENVGLRFDKLWMDGTLMRFEGFIVGTAQGRDLQAVLDAGVEVGMSTNVNGVLSYLPARDVDSDWPEPDELIGVVQPGARLITIDAVMNPSDLAGNVQAADSLQDREEVVKDLKELKEKYPELYAQALAEGKRGADTSSLEDALAAERAERLKLEKRLQDDARRAIARTALADAKLPKLGKSGEIDLDARFEKRVTDAALRAETDEEAQTEVAALIAERRLSVRDDAQDNNPNVPTRASVKDAAKTRSTLAAARGFLD